MRVEVAFALPAAQDVVALELEDGAVAGDAVAASGLLTRHGLAAERIQLGVSGKKASPRFPLREGDRVEILRPLAMDPNEARRRRARKSRV